MKILPKYLFVFLVIAGINGYSATAHAQKSKAAIKQLLMQRDQQIKDVIGPKGKNYTDQQRQKLKDIINGVIDYRSMAKYALQDTYNDISSAKQTEFVDLFSTIIRDNSLNQLDIYRANISYRSIELDGDDATAHILATRKDVRKSVVYKLHYDEDSNKWVVTDFIIDDVSTADSYRRQFQNIIRKKGFNSLMETLRKRANR